GRPQALPRHTAGRLDGQALLHQLLTTAGRFYQRSIRGAAATGAVTAEIHRRHGTASVHGRTPGQRGRLSATGAAGTGQLSAALSDRYPNLFHLSASRLSEWRA